MSWSSQHYPLSMKSLRPAVRSKAIDIANELTQAGMRESSAVEIAIVKARKMVEHR